MSTVQGLGQTPLMWSTVEARRLFSLRREPPLESDEIVTAFRDGVVTKRSDRRTEGFTQALKETGYQHVAAGDLVVHSMDGFAGAIGVADSDGKMSPVANIYKVSGDARYFAYTLRSLALSGFVASLAKGIRERSTSFDDATLASVELPWPPIHEQRRIADFLDDRVARIDQIITARQHQIRLLYRALASDVAGLVASDGKDWITGSLRRFARSCDSLRVPLNSEERAKRRGKYPYFGASGVIDHVDDYLFDGPKVLVSEDGANLLLRSTAIAFVADGQYWVNNHAHILEPFDGAHDFWAARIEALDISPWVTGSAQPKLTIDAAMALPMSAPAQVDTRRALGRQVVDARAAVEKRAWALEKSGTLLQEYKQSLITAAVTGELDVTTAGSGIPNPH